MRAYLRLFCALFLFCFGLFIWLPFSFTTLCIGFLTASLLGTLLLPSFLTLFMKRIVQSKPTRFGDASIEVHVFENPGKLVYKILPPWWTGQRAVFFLSTGATESFSANELNQWLNAEKLYGQTSLAKKGEKINAASQFLALIAILFRRGLFFHKLQGKQGVTHRRSGGVFGLVKLLFYFVWPEDLESYFTIDPSGPDFRQSSFG